MKRVALYGRNSKPPRGWKPSYPGEEPPGSWRQQLDVLRAWAAREGYNVVQEEHDANVSGRDGNRPGWKRIMSSVRGRHVHIVAAIKLDRVMRSVVHYHQTADVFLERGVDLVFTETGLRISKQDAMSKYFINNLASIAELERDLAKERQDAVMSVREDGRTYGPRSEQPAGRPSVYRAADGHKMRIRNGREVHDKGKCRHEACRVA